ncbi:MAG: DUF3747 domain-containing protein [Elainellaceae cyanobacterium]
MKSLKSLRRVAALAAVATTAAAGAIAAVAPIESLAAAPLFGQKEVDQNKFVAIAAPFGRNNHQLLVLEQVSSERSCWAESGAAPVVIDPLLTNFDFTGICGRSTDSNGYSIRVDGEDLGLQYSLRVVERDGDLKLVGRPFQLGNGSELEIGSASGSADGFVKLNLNPGWQFAKRTYQGQTLGHVYLSYDSALPGVGLPVEAPTEETTPSQFTFADTANDIYASDIEAAVERGFVAGFYEDNTFRPQQTLTREQLVSMVVEALVTLPEADIAVPAQASGRPYPDVDASRWSAAKIQFARDNNIVSGYQDGTFRPTQTVTRAELMAILRRAAEYSQGEQANATLWPTQEMFEFSDVEGHWASRVVTQMSSYCGVASPLNESGTAFYPNSATQRNYAAAATLRMLGCADGVAEEGTATASR